MLKLMLDEEETALMEMSDLKCLQTIRTRHIFSKNAKKPGTPCLSQENNIISEVYALTLLCCDVT